MNAIISSSKLAIASLFLALWLGLLLPSLERSHLQNWDELWHACPAQSAVLEGQWWPLMWDGHPFFDKPPLMPWLVAVTVAISGEPRAAWPYRIWNTLAGALTLACLIALGALAGRFWGGLFAAALFGLQGDFVFHSRFFSMDTPFLGLSCLAALAMAWALGGERGAAPRKRSWSAAGGALALAFWCKSWFVFALAPAVGLALWAALPTQQRSLALNRLAWPVAVSIVAWLFLYSAWVGPEFLRQEWQHNILGRVTGPANQPFGDHLQNYLSWGQRSAPAMVLLALAVMLGLSPRREVNPAVVFIRVLAWMLSVTWFLGLILVRSDTINYLLPLELALALTLGLALFDEHKQGTQQVLAVLLLVAGLATQRILSPEYSLALGAVLGAALVWIRRSPATLLAPGKILKSAACLLLLLQVPDAVGLCFRPLDDHKILVAFLDAHPARHPKEILWAVRIPTRAVEFYSNYKVEHVDTLAQAKGGHAIVFAGPDGHLRFVPPTNNP